MSRIATRHCAAVALALIGASMRLHAQDVADDRFLPLQPQSVAESNTPPPPGLVLATDVPTMDNIKALPPEEGELLDLYRFRNPVEVEANRFGRAWDEQPSPAQMALNGGYLLKGIQALTGAVSKGLRAIPGVKGQISHAVARPPPLDAAQLERAARLNEADAADEGERLLADEAVPRD